MTDAPANLNDSLTARALDVHKGNCGHVCVVAGSLGMTGAASLAALGALRTGAGLVSLGVPETCQSICATQLMEVMVRSVSAGSTMQASAVPKVVQWLNSYDVLALGPGLGRSTETVEAVCQLLPLVQVPCVVDADALFAVSQHLDALATMSAPRVITPHPGEAALMLEMSVEDVQADRSAAAARLAEGTNSIVVLKGFQTLVVKSGMSVYTNTTGNPGMATAGVGDILTGVIAALLGQGVSPFDAASVGTFLHGVAGDLARDECGERGLTATDVLEALPKAIRQFEGFAGVAQG